MNTLPVPVTVLNAHCAVLGKTGAGKSSLMRVIVEDLLRRGKRVCVIDPKGDWYGLKLSADGKSAGYPVITFGDFVEEKATDVPINEHSGKHVAELISSGNRPCVIGFRGWMPGKMTKFWIDFASTLFNSKSGELYLVGDEFHNFAPKGKVLDPEAGKSLHWSNRLLSEGRGLGLVILIASQRPQKVHNDTLTCCETLFAMRVVHSADRGAIEDWIDGCGDPSHGKEVLASVASLKRGEAYVWCPEHEFGPKRVQFPMFSTFDSFAPPQLQKKISAAGWAGVDLDAVKEKLAAVIEEAKANDPAELKREIARLKKEVEKSATIRDSQTVQPKEIPVLSDDERKRLETLIKSFDALYGEVEGLFTKIADISGATEALKPDMQIIKAKLGHNPPKSFPTPVRAVNLPKNFGQITPRLRNGNSYEPSIGRCERAILTALAQYPQGRTVTQVAVLTGYSGNSGGFNNALGKLRSSEYITREQPMRITDAGLEALGDWTPLPSGQELQAHWLNQLGKCERAILETLLNIHPEGMTAQELGDQTGYSANSGGFNNALGRLRTLELITRGQPIKASDHFFQEA